VHPQRGCVLGLVLTVSSTLCKIHMQKSRWTHLSLLTMVLKKDGWPLRAGPKFRVWTDKPDDTYLVIVSMIYRLQKVAGETHCDVADARFVDMWTCTCGWCSSCGVRQCGEGGTWGKLSFSLLQDRDHPCRHISISANPRQIRKSSTKTKGSYISGRSC
jgi:hypothetical protein